MRLREKFHGSLMQHTHVHTWQHILANFVFTHQIFLQNGLIPQIANFLLKEVDEIEVMRLIAQVRGKSCVISHFVNNTTFLALGWQSLVDSIAPVMCLYLLGRGSQRP